MGVDLMAHGGAASDPSQMFDTVNLGYGPDWRETSGRTAVSPRLIAERTLILPVIGQSYLASYVQAQLTPANAKTQNLNLWNGGVYTAAEPLLGDNYDLSSRGSIATRIADKLITDNYCDRAIVIPSCVGGASSTTFIPGGVFNHRLRAIASRLHEFGYTAKLVLCDIGPTDGAAGMSQGTFSANVSAMLTSLSGYGVTCPVMLSKSSYTSGSTYSAITNAQAALWNGTTILQGPDVDAIVGGQRYGGGHYTDTGGNTARDLWLTPIKTYLDAHPL
jgi:hypothetical protein